MTTGAEVKLSITLPPVKMIPEVSFYRVNRAISAEGVLKYNTLG
jgi:hypothetical protein